MTSKSYSNRILTVAFIFVIFFIATMLLLPLLQRILHLDLQSRSGLLVVSVFQNVMAFIAPSLVAAWMISKNPASLLRLKRPPSLKSILGVAITFVIAYPALNQIIYWNSNLHFPEALETLGAQLKDLEDNAQEVTSLMLNTKSLGGLIINFVIISLLTAFGEELFFRGTLQSTAASQGAHHTSIWVVALIFSAFHFQVYGFIPRLLLGAWFGYLIFWTGSVYVPVIAHAINNGVVVVCSWLTARGLTSVNFEMFGVSEYGFPMTAFLSALFTILFLYFFHPYFFSHKGCKRRYYDTKKAGLA